MSTAFWGMRKKTNIRGIYYPARGQAEDVSVDDVRVYVYRY